MSDIHETEWLKFLDTKFKLQGYRGGVVVLEETHTPQSAIDGFGLADLVILWEAYNEGECTMYDSDGTINATYTRILEDN
jgi:hypothetical protein